MSDQIVKQTNLCAINKQTSNPTKHWNKWKLFSLCDNNGQTIALWARLSLTVLDMNSYHQLLKPFLFLLLVDKCFSETTIQPIQKDGCPLLLVHGVPRYCQSPPLILLLDIHRIILVSRRIEAEDSRSVSSPDWVEHLQEGDGGRGKPLSLQVNLKIDHTI